ncbi:MAG TPA: hypothetical protein VGS59_11795 [Candidatus Acidoferrales bacterium]|nr:hypothetical protein [Candidatus Acidoferrales bacterium]
MRAAHRTVFLLLLGLTATTLAQGQTAPNCEPVASLPPMATFGGPLTAPRGETELGIGVGGSGELNEITPQCAEVELGTTDWLVRWRRGVGDKTDMGFDWVISNTGGNGQIGTVKFAVRQRAAKGLRLEGGVGTADSGFTGRSISADAAAVIGTTNVDNTWNYYASLRVAASHGCINLVCLGGSGLDHNPGGIVPLGVIGASARVTDNIHFLMEAGLGEVFSRQHPDPVGYIHLSFGVQFDVGKKKQN